MDKYQQNAQLIWERIKKARYILIVTHINPDPDTISSALALSNLFSEQKIKHKVFNKGKNLPRNVDFLEGFSKITNQVPEFYDLVISVDCGTRQRLGLKTLENIDLINIDHHISNNNFGTINLVDANKASTAELVYYIFKTNELKISKNSAQCLYAGIYEDSLAFSTVRCDATTFLALQDLIDVGVNPGIIAEKLRRRDSLAKYRIIPKVLDSLTLHKEGKVGIIILDPLWLKQTGAKASDCELALDMVLNIAIVDIAIFLRESKNKVRVSLRSKNNVDVARIANKFDGGGHSMAAGCVLKNMKIEEAKRKILESIDE